MERKMNQNCCVVYWFTFYFIRKAHLTKGGLLTGDPKSLKQAGGKEQHQYSLEHGKEDPSLERSRVEKPMALKISTPSASVLGIYRVLEVHSVKERERGGGGREGERERKRETERQRDRSDHHCCAEIGDEFTLSLAKNSCFSFLKSQMVTFVALNFAISSHFPLPKEFTLFVQTLLIGATSN